MQRCFGCMKEYGEEYDVCPYCGYIKDTPPKNKSHLPGGTMLSGRYMLGKVLGYGGFGVTYIAWDTRLNRAVAVKEFFPNSLSTRTIGETQVNCYDDKASQYFREGVRKMMDEGNRLSKFSSNENIVDVYDCFEENNTAYIVMEYLEGEDLKQYLGEKGGKLSPEEAVEIILPVLNALEDMHRENIIHRDISPDNIFICKNGKIKLLDFGSARLAVEDSDKSLSIMIKKGYAPKEQYAGRSKQGSWTDVYAVCATLYKMITGELPPESLERDTEPLKTFSEFGIEGYDELERVVFKGLEVEYTDRIQNVLELKNGLTKTVSKKPETIEETPKKPSMPKPKKSKANINIKAIVSIAAAVVLVVVGAVLAAKFISGGKIKKSGTSTTAEASTTAKTSETVKIALDEAEAKNIYEQFLLSDNLKSTYPVINAFVNKDASLCKKEDLESFDMELLNLKDLTKSTVKKDYYDLDGDGTNEMLIALDVNGENERVSVYLFDIDGQKAVFNGATWEQLAPSRAYDHLSVMKDNNEKYYFVEFTNDGQYEKNCEKLIYDGTKLKREFSLSIPDDNLVGYASPDFAKCTLQDKSLRSEKEYPEENEIEYITYDEACEEWSKLFSATRVTGYCDDSWKALNSKVELTNSGKVNDNITWKLYKTGYLMIEGTGNMPDYNYPNLPPWEKVVDSIAYVALSKGITSIGDGAFPGCENLKSVIIPNSVISIGDSAFFSCESLTSLEIPNSVTSIGESAFMYCGLASIEIPDGVINIGNGAFSKCYNLTSVIIPASVTHIEGSAFSYCESITVDKNNQYYSSDEYGVLFDKNKTLLIRFPAGNTATEYTVPDTVTSIDDWAFYNCSLTSVTIPNSVTSIGEGAFFKCYDLINITIPDSVKRIGKEAFFDCVSISDVYYSGSILQWNAITIDEGNDALTNAKIHYNS